MNEERYDEPIKSTSTESATGGRERSLIRPAEDPPVGPGWPPGGVVKSQIVIGFGLAVATFGLISLLRYNSRRQGEIQNQE